MVKALTCIIHCIVSIVVAAALNPAFADKNVGTNKPVSVTGISISGADAGNYTLLNTTASTTANIAQKDLTVTVDAQSKVYGNTDPSLTYTITSGSLVTGDSITGSLTRVSGENVGSYAINQGTLTAGGNYNLSYVGANLAIAPAALTITADDATKIYGTKINLTDYTVEGLVSGDTVTSVALTSSGAAVNAAVGTYAIVPSSAKGTGLSNYNISYVDGTLTVKPTALFANGKVYKIFEWPILEILRTIRLNARDIFVPARGVYFYHPLTPIDTAAFDSMFNLGEDAYSFMNGRININGHDGLLPILSGIRK